MVSGLLRSTGFRCLIFLLLRQKIKFTVALGFFFLLVSQGVFLWKTKDSVSLPPVVIDKVVVPSQTSKGCLLDLEQHINNTIDTCFKEDVPLLMNTFLINGTYYLIFLVKHLIDTRKWENAEWHCNNGSAVSIKTGRRSSNYLMVTCPQTPLLTHVTHVSSSDASNVTSLPKEYDVRLFVECDEIAFQEHHDILSKQQGGKSTTITDKQQLANNNKPATKIGACTRVQGGEARHLTSQWIEYHHMIGVDHIWIYVNEKFDLTSLPQRPYVTYVPGDFNPQEHRFYKFKIFEPFFWQAEVQGECILRARQLDFDWMILTDVDEFIQVSSPGLKEYLDRVPNQDAIGGVQMNSIPYGTNMNFNNSKQKHPLSTIEDTLFADYVWRNKIDPGKAQVARWKNIVKPWNVNSHDVHYIMSGRPTVSVNANDLRINHYKMANSRVFQSKPQDLVVDSYIQETFGDRLVEALRDVKNFTRSAAPR